ncbi:MAG: aspartyl protease family protein [Brevundimonas sp.]|uniref:aspartyl protease family protein n=1 Tax=Brevundimonas sp. TaxID=1871086 RepID=UPI00272389ED|nr:aspartyl protease family protein [Brevundimonas sp.]MDO9586807.1 aspartyl protease family protein [Brevundimonas sp.]MDP3368386.1 aspartyl protease family protein [Brevundimonas sp.]MDP3657004.1 aspartyl protease family protein [Brevundimonas sp.]MDZ4111353.1 aspartyl protease family protein [Brevundimonas sp.]
MLGPDRRALLAGLAGAFATGAGCVPAAAQETETELPPIQLLTNLFTRVGAAVFIDGRGPFIFVIDTGAGTTSLADTLADRLALPSRPPMLVHGITEATVTRSVGVERLTLGGLGFRNLACPVFPRDQLGADGLIGLDVLERFRLRFDIVRRTASLTVRGVSIVMGGGALTGSRIRRDGLRAVDGRFGQMITTQVTVNGQQTAAFVDSGAQYSIGNQTLLRAVSARRGEGGRPGRTVPILGVTGQSLRADLAEVQDLRLGAIQLGSTPLLFADLHCFETLELSGRPAMLIGGDLLGRFREVTLDFPANKITFAGLRRRTTGRLEIPGR